MGPHGLSSVEGPPEYVDWVARMQAFLAAHPGVSWLRPGPESAVMYNTATWIEADPDPAVDGETVTVERLWLSDLVRHLEARFR